MVPSTFSEQVKLPERDGPLSHLDPRLRMCGAIPLLSIHILNVVLWQRGISILDYIRPNFVTSYLVKLKLHMEQSPS
jgi:hypothetical protein